ncbi:hypothetical protein KIW84_030796 [Lathyrus oleraceus]|uniref:DUF7745 domain-containing protein n=1 Tax=Pisum sativum TaxID=3888 RepID=A0A9D4XTM1_PEA|nr:hypothetical protein KIW84_030796 [Pisum sativum]
MEMNKRTTLRIKATIPDLQSLRILQGLMPNSIQRKFTLKYGGILDLLRVPVKAEAVTALAQKGPYMGMGQKINPKDLAMTLGISPEDLLLHYKEDKDVQGLRRSYLEGVARRMVGIERWGSYIDVMALIMFGIVLFPNVGDFVDVSAIRIFWAVKNLEVDLVPALLDDVYYTMSIFHSKEKGSMRCCIPLLYQCLASHLYRDIHLIETKGNHAWAQNLASLNEGFILWYPKEIDTRDIIISCGSFPNVPLIGSKGCINYNPVMALRQLGHPIWERPKEDEIEEFILHGGEASYREQLRKVTRAWEKVHVKDNKPKRKDTSSGESYTPWIKERISYDLEQKDRQLLENMEELRTERSKRQKTLGGLFSAGVNFENLNEALRKSLAVAARQRQLRTEAEQMLPLNWRKIYQEIRNLRKQIHLQNQDHEVLTTQVAQLDGEIHHLRDLSAAAQVIVQEQGDRAEAWRIEHSNLAEFANNLVRDIPRMFRRADGMANFHNTPQEVLEFIRLCGVMLEEFKAHLKKAMNTPL